MNRLILLRHHLVSLACISLATATFVACGSGSTVNPNDTEKAIDLMLAETSFLDEKDGFLANDEKIAAQIEKCNNDPSACNVGDLPSTPTESSSSQSTPSESSSSEAPIESSASVDPSSSSVVVKPSSSSQTTLPSSSSVAKSSSSSVSSSSSAKSSSSVAPSSSSQTTPSSSSTGSGSTVSLVPNADPTPLNAGTYTVNHTCTQKMAFKCEDGSCDITVGTESISPGWYSAINIPTSGVSVSSAENFQISCY